MNQRRSAAWLTSLFGLSALIACTATESAPPDDDVESGDGDDSGSKTGGSSSGGSQVVLGSGGAPASSSGGMTQNMGGDPGPVPIPACDANEQCDDGSPCTDDACVEGYCEWEDNGTCACKTDTDCADENECTATSCVGYQCVSENVEGSCLDDGNPCTEDVCDSGACTNLDSGVCGEDTITIRSMRWGNEGQWISLNPSGALVWNLASSFTESELFEREAIADTGTFRLRALSNNLYVTLGVGDAYVASAPAEQAATFSAYSCGVEYGISTVSDDDDYRHFKAFEAGVLLADGATCAASNPDAWERFEIVEVAAPGFGGAGGMSSF